MRKVYVGVSALMLLAVIAQFYLAAMGAFTKPPDVVRPNESFSLHAANGYIVIPVLSLLATIAAAVARAPGRLIALSFVPFILNHGAAPGPRGRDYSVPGRPGNAQPPGVSRPVLLRGGRRR